jgi:hypothetical protein
LLKIIQDNPMSSVTPSNQLATTYYGLGKDWRKQIIDANHHALGPQVFDEGLHHGHIEPGYLKGIDEGSAYAVKALESNDLSVDIYKQIHKITCSHFNGDQQSGTAGKETPGNFRHGQRLREVVEMQHWGATPEEQQLMEDFPHTKIIGAAISNSSNKFGVNPDNRLGEVPACINKYYRTKWDQLGDGRDEVIDIVDRTFKNADTLNDLMKARAGEGAKDVHFETCDDAIIVHFNPLTDLETAIPKLFDAFNQAIKKTETPDEKLKLIADLFQTLEWKHAPADGTTRVDLIVLNALLSKHGFNPTILPNPAFASFHTPEEWLAHLKVGMEAWRQEKASHVTA